MNSASLCSLAGRYDNPIPPQFLAPIGFFTNSSSEQIAPGHIIQEMKEKPSPETPRKIKEMRETVKTRELNVKEEAY